MESTSCSILITQSTRLPKIRSWLSQLSVRDADTTVLGLPLFLLPFLAPQSIRKFVALYGFPGR